MVTDDKEIITSTMERVEDVRFIMLVMKSSYRTYVNLTSSCIMILFMTLI